MTRSPLVRLGALAVVAAMFFGPLVASGELAFWVFEEPVSHLVWDERMVGPGDVGAVDPGSDDRLSGPVSAAVSFVVLPVVLGLVAGSWAQAMARP